MYKHVHEVPPTVRALRPEVPLELSDALARALAKRPDQRFPSMEELAAALSSAPREHAALASRDDETLALAPTGRSPARRSIGWRLALGAALALIVGMAVLIPTWQSDPPRTPNVPSDPASSSDVPRGPTSPRATATPQSPAESVAVATGSPAVAGPDSAAMPAAPRPQAAKKPPARPAPGDSALVVPPPSAAVGFLTVNAIPYGTVSIDGVEIGDTPIVRRELPPGEHTLRIVRDGFRTDVVKVPITTGNEVRLSRTLVKEGQ
jgi:serine/threonine-protein kinase